jgi:hypothetical protein
VTTYTGVLVFHSETGTEGGHYALQDEKFMNLPAPNQWRCPRCSTVWDKNRDPDNPPRVRFTYWRDMEGQTNSEGHRYISSYAGYDEPHDDLPLAPPNEASDGPNAQYTKRSNDALLECYHSGHEEFEHMYPHGIWSYEGLHYLHDGDHLTIRHPETGLTVFDGPVRLVPQELFTHSVGGLWVHSVPEGVDEEAWAAMFFQEWPATLVQEDAE